MQSFKPVTKKKTLGYKVISNTEKLLGLKEKVKTHPFIEYFHPTKHLKTALQPSKSLTNRVTNRKGKLLVKSSDTRYDDLGKINTFGNIEKQIRETQKFHKRWCVLRGFSLYWFRELTSDQD